MRIERIEPGPRLSQAVVHGDTIYIAGQVAADASADAAAQTRQILAQIDQLLSKAGSDKSRLVWANVWLADMADFAAMNAEWEAWIPAGATPARATVEAKLALPQFKVEIACIAARGRGRVARSAGRGAARKSATRKAATKKAPVKKAPKKATAKVAGKTKPKRR